MGGNIVFEKVSFVKEIIDAEAFDYIVTKRIDTIYFKANSLIDLTGIILSCPITTSIQATIRISEADSEQEMHSQTLSIEKQGGSYFKTVELSQNVRLKAGHQYKITVYYTGGATYTFDSLHEHICHQNVILEVKKGQSLTTSESQPTRRPKISNSNFSSAMASVNESIRNSRGHSTPREHSNDTPKRHSLHRKKKTSFSTRASGANTPVNNTSNSENNFKMNLICGIYFSKPPSRRIC